MKKIILSIFSLLFLITSCASDDDIVKFVTPDYISGKWFFKEVGTVNGQSVVVYKDYINQETCEQDNLSLVNTDKTFSLSDFMIEGQTCVNKGYTGSFSIVNRDLKLNYTQENNNIETVYTIVSLTNTDLIISTLNDLGEVTFYKLSK